MNIREDLRKLREKHIRWALEVSKGNVRLASRYLGLNPTTTARWMRECNLQEFAARLRHNRQWWLAGDIKEQVREP